MKIGFIGLGNMGGGMAKNLRAKGFDVVGYDQNSEVWVGVELQGVRRADSIADIASGCDDVILCLPNPDISRTVIFEQLIVDNSSYSTIIETSTLTPEIVTEFAEKIRDGGKRFLSAPMVGGKSHASDGKVIFLVEGQKEISRDYESVLRAMGEVRYMGDVPSATLAKIAFNLSRYANLAAGVETYRLLRQYDVNIPAIYDFVSEQSLDNFGQVWREDLKEMMATDVAFRPSKVPSKDLALFVEMARSKGLDSGLIEAILGTYLSME